MDVKDELVMSESLRDFVESNGSEALIMLDKDLDNKIAMAKERNQMLRIAAEELEAEIIRDQNQSDSIKAQAVKVRESIAQLRKQLNTAKAEKSASKKIKQESAPVLKQGTDFHEQIEAQRNQIEILRAQIEELEMQKIDAQKAYAETHTAFKEASERLDQLSEKHGNALKNQEFLSETYDDLRITNLRETVDHLKAKLNSSLDGASTGESLFDEVIAQKKLLETELLSLVEATNVLRFQIRQKQDEIDELERETEDAYNVDMKYVLSKMQKLIDEYDVVCKEIIAIEPDLKSNVEQFEKSISISDDEKPSAASAQYANLRNYAFDCLKSVNRECNEAHGKLKARFSDLNQLSSEFVKFQDRRLCGSPNPHKRIE